MPALENGVVEGRIIFVDGFVNLVSNFRPLHLPEGPVEVRIGDAVIHGLSRTYADADGLTALIGSHGYLEVAETNGSATERMESGVGGRVSVTSDLTEPQNESPGA